VMVAPGRRREIVSESGPVTLTWPLPDQVAKVTAAGKGSLTERPVAVEGPLLVTTIV